MLLKNTLLIPSLAVLMVLGAMQVVWAGSINQVDGVALHGFDPVAYFTQHKAVKGDPDFSASFDGVTYEFASLKDQKLFELNPTKYVPQYGGFCAFGVSEGAKADVDPHAFRIIDGKLYLNYSEQVQADFNKNPGQRVQDADKKWSDVSQQDKVIH